MFKIQGADQNEYGPVSADTVRQWIAERRADGRTLIQAQGATEWRPLSEFPEFAAALGRGAPPPMPGATLQTSQSGVKREPYDGPPKTSGMAIASLVCGIFGFLCVPGLVGLILGIIALVKIKASEGRLKGSGLAVAGICVSALMMLFLALAALLLPALSKAKHRAQAISCMSNMRQLALAVRIYSTENKETLPPADSWCDAIQSYVSRNKVFQCNADRSGQRSSYAMNKNVAGLKESKIDPQTVLLFEIDGGWNVAGGPELLIRPRHSSRVVGFADGSVRQLFAYELPTLRWDP